MGSTHFRFDPHPACKFHQSNCCWKAWARGMPCNHARNPNAAIPSKSCSPPLCIFSRQDPVGFLLSELWYQKLIPPPTVDPELKRASGGTCQRPPTNGRNLFLSIPGKLSTGSCLTISLQKEAHALTRGPSLWTAVIVFRQQVLWEIEAAMGCGKTCL